MARHVTRRAPPPPPKPRWDSTELELVNTMDRSPDPLAVATAAIRHAALTRRPVPDYTTALRADRLADQVVTALYRRGMV
jgi:hypothetical protein